MWGMTLSSVTESPDKFAVDAGSTGTVEARSANRADRDMGAALRSVYQRTVDEAVPDDLMSLLGKLD